MWNENSWEYGGSPGGPNSGIVEFLLHNPQLKILDLAGESLSLECGCGCLSRPLAVNGIGAEGAKAIAAGLTQLTTLDLGGESSLSLTLGYGCVNILADPLQTTGLEPRAPRPSPRD